MVVHKKEACLVTDVRLVTASQGKKILLEGACIHNLVVPFLLVEPTEQNILLDGPLPRWVTMAFGAMVSISK